MGTEPKEGSIRVLWARGTICPQGPQAPTVFHNRPRPMPSPTWGVFRMQPLLSPRAGLVLGRGTPTSRRQPGLGSCVQGRGPAGQPGCRQAEGLHASSSDWLSGPRPAQSLLQGRPGDLEGGRKGGAQDSLSEPDGLCSQSPGMSSERRRVGSALHSFTKTFIHSLKH